MGMCSRRRKEAIAKIWEETASGCAGQTSSGGSLAGEESLQRRLWQKSTCGISGRQLTINLCSRVVRSSANGEFVGLDLARKDGETKKILAGEDLAPNRRRSGVEER